ncbi:hypothetical protein BDZ89DRAFT_66142 [Hymenopellis radicata]|nr:hypothetical protein BDZ89DRAFT_66142 [Hymenopellis radicata]
MKLVRAGPTLISEQSVLGSALTRVRWTVSRISLSFDRVSPPRNIMQTRESLLSAIIFAYAMSISCRTTSVNLARTVSALLVRFIGMSDWADTDADMLISRPYLRSCFRTGSDRWEGPCRGGGLWVWQRAAEQGIECRLASFHVCR